MSGQKDGHIMCQRAGSKGGKRTTHRKGVPASLDVPAPTVTAVSGNMAGSPVLLVAPAQLKIIPVGFHKGRRARTMDEPMPSEGDLPVTSGTADKPAYRVLGMQEVEALPWNGLKVASTFSGCGGSCLGFRMAGFRVAWSSEFIASARETYRANHPHAILDERDIRTVKPEEVLAALSLKKGELDVFEGSPPCASFSMAGKREKLWGKQKAYSDKKQRTDDLFTEYLRLLGGLMPRTFVAENVAGMVVGTAKGHFLEAIKAMRALGYRVGAKILDAQWLGVPQARRRVIFIGVREDLGFDPPFPKPLPYRYSIRDALPWLGSASVVHDTSGLWGAGEVSERPVPTITVGVNSLSSAHFKVFAPPTEEDLCGKVGRFGHRPRNGVYSEFTPPAGEAQPPTEDELRALNFEERAIGPEWAKLAPGQGSDHYLNLARSHPDRPCPTVTATGGSSPGVAGVTHPSEPRKFTITELRRLCGFPDDFVLKGSYAQQWERLGRAVPPVMMAAVARELGRALLEYDAKKGGA